MKVLMAEPFYGGSHRLFADRYAALSSHEVTVLTLPASFWKWRMRGGHLSLAPKIRERLGSFDCFVCSDMLSLAELVGIVPPLAGLPRIVYFHENQLGYPVPKGESPDVHFGFTNLSTALAADRLVFNSQFHREQFLEGIETFLQAMPDHRPRRLAETLRPRCDVVYPGVDCRELDGGDMQPDAAERPGPPVLLWNHRWEFDKQPEVFFRILETLAGEGLDFRLHVVGENFQAQPKPFHRAKEVLGERLETFGFLPERSDYIRVLHDSDIVVSTAVQEFYGIAVMEAVYCRCLPLLPDRLVYPELYGPEELYGSEEGLEARLRSIVQGGLRNRRRQELLRQKIRETHDVRRTAALLDGIVEESSGS